jgi:hypothetical protein
MPNLDYTDIDDTDEQRTKVPERSNRRSLKRRVEKRAQRSRSNETAKRGIHQRRNKRVAW